MLSIVRKVTDAMMDFAPAFVRPAEKCLFRIYRDTRFSADKLPYKTHVAAWWSHQGLVKTSGAGLLLPREPEGRDRSLPAPTCPRRISCQIRHWLLDHHPEFRKLLQKPAVRKTFEEFEGNALTRPPKGFPCEHPGMDLIRCRQWGLAATLPAKDALKKDFAATVIRYFRIAAPVVDALNRPIAAAQPPKRRSCSACNSGDSRIDSVISLGLITRSKPASAADFRLKTRQIKAKRQNHQKPKKTVENRVFPLTLPPPKPHCNERQGSSKPA